ncbi:MAG: hypothetical protein K6E98_13340 [Lachnospiraceae bacterium]|nr:hypothetical protein [Lachnospiraceae bacterium]
MKYVMTKRDIMLIMIIIGILIAGGTYYFVYMGYTVKTEELKVLNDGLQSRVDVLQSIADQQAELVQATNDYNARVEQIMEKYPADFRDEDGFMMAVDMQAVSPFETVSAVTNTDEAELYRFEDVKTKTDELVKGYIPEQNAAAAAAAPAEGEEGPETAIEESQPAPDPAVAAATLPGLMYKDTTINCTCDYDAFKNAVAYILDRNEKHSITIQAVYDITTGTIASAYKIRSPYVVNTDKVYVEPDVPFIVQGTDNIFGTISLEDSRAVTYGTTREANGEENNEMTEEVSEEAEENAEASEED